MECDPIANTKIVFCMFLWHEFLMRNNCTSYVPRPTFLNQLVWYSVYERDIIGVKQSNLIIQQILQEYVLAFENLK